MFGCCAVLQGSRYVAGQQLTAYMTEVPALSINAGTREPVQDPGQTSSHINARQMIGNASMCSTMNMLSFLRHSNCTCYTHATHVLHSTWQNQPTHTPYAEQCGSCHVHLQALQHASHSLPQLPLTFNATSTAPHPTASEAAHQP